MKELVARLQIPIADTTNKRRLTIMAEMKREVINAKGAPEPVGPLFPCSSSR